MSSAAKVTIKTTDTEDYIIAYGLEKKKLKEHTEYLKKNKVGKLQHTLVIR